MGSDNIKKDPFEGLMVSVPAGVYKNPVRSGVRYPNNDKRKKPVPFYAWEWVTIEKGFKICKYKVTQKQWKEIMGEGFNRSLYLGDDFPVTGNSFDEVEEFISRLCKLTGKNYGLPDGDKWRWAALGAHKDADRAPFSGAKCLKEIGEYAEMEQPRFSVGKKKPNEIGLYDMQSSYMGELVFPSKAEREKGDHSTSAKKYSYNLMGLIKESSDITPELLEKTDFFDATEVMSQPIRHYSVMARCAYNNNYQFSFRVILYED